LVVQLRGSSELDRFVFLAVTIGFGFGFGGDTDIDVVIDTAAHKLR
jgi:hypothetical protein|tara:strand:- start:476 stop:613 length:138 start_codon:yes stop_codon:yes gene_type:complete